ncbi:MAG: twin-arginine translocase TatA/TatE family subunit [Lachnospiraceae bacterium]|nr:twin-arginine translocase TatA/TatE family subunit [Lachnospiraceae bacterium]
MKIGIQELLVVFIVALVVVGPDKLPYYAKKLGQAFGQFRKYTEEATKDIREGIVEPLNEAQKPLREAMEPVTELEKDIKHNVDDIKKSLSDIGKPVTDESKEPDAVSQEVPEAEADEKASDQTQTA